MNSIATHIEIVRQRIRKAAIAAGRDPAEIQLLCVSKYASLDAIKAAIMAGQTAFAESYVQNALQKITRYINPWRSVGCHLCF